MKIYNTQGIELLDIEVNDNSFRYRSIMKGNSVTLYYSLTEHVEIPAGSYIVLPGNEKYTLFKPENFSKKGTREFEYTVVFESEGEVLKRYKYKFITRDDESGRKTYELKFPYTATPRQFLELLVENLNDGNPAGTPKEHIWKVGECIEATEKPLSFSHDYCYDVLTRLAAEFNTEWEVEGRTVHLRRVEKFKGDPLPLSYGKGNGFKTGVGRQAQGDKPPVTRLYVEGGDRNIDVNTYKNKTLLLPKGKTYDYEGRTYMTDDDGIYLYRGDKLAAAVNEDSLDAGHIYPNRVGEVTKVITVDAGKNLYKFTDNTIPEDLNYSRFRLPEEKATVIFQSGSLTGLEFQIKQTGDEEITGYNHGERSFELEPLSAYDTVLPNETLRIREGDKYAVFHISLPEAYICNDANQTGASWEMFKEAARYMYDNEEERFGFTGELDGIWARKNWLNIGGKIIPGAYIRFSDTQFQPEGILIRITGVKDLINDPYSQEIELSNVSVGGFVSNDLGKIDSNEVQAGLQQKNAIQYTQRRWRDTQETMTMLENTVGGFSEGIKPIWVQAMSVLVGDEGLQFKFVRKSDTSQTVQPNFTFEQDTQQFRITYPADTLLLHMTLGAKTLSPSGPDPDKTRSWELNGSEFLSSVLNDPNPLYLYVRCDKSGSLPKGRFELSRAARKMEEDDAYYFLVGTLSSLYENERSFVTLYGFTEILPGRINVDRITSADGVQFWDMANKAFFLGGKDSHLSYNANNDGKLVLKGTLLQSPSGVQPVGVFRGAFVYSTIYEKGDLVTYEGSTYRYKYDTPYFGKYPTETTYWEIYAQKGDDGNNGSDGANGAPGTPGRGYMHIYHSSVNNEVPSTPTAPTPTSTVPGLPSGWDASPVFWYDDKYIFHSQSIQTNGLWGAWSEPKLYGIKPNDGSPGPSIVFRGEYNSIPATERVFYNNANRRDVVKYNEVFYLYNYTDGYPNSTFVSSRWENFGAQFSSVATDLLLAKNANIGGWIIKNQRLESQSGGAFLDGRTGTLVTNGGIFRGSISTPFKDYTGVSGSTMTLTDNYNVKLAPGAPFTLYLPSNAEEGVRCLIMNTNISKSGFNISVKAENGLVILGADSYTVDIPISCCIGEFISVIANGLKFWYCTNYKDLI
ncbi:MAG: hypothetical protein LBV32_01700 [Tannerellaceae bacterium]|jgi:hypothetical protein|nr:hypothetical protein [Tannerellaceae bacterium]